MTDFCTVWQPHLLCHISLPFFLKTAFFSIPFPTGTGSVIFFSRLLLLFFSVHSFPLTPHHVLELKRTEHINRPCEVLANWLYAFQHSCWVSIDHHPICSDLCNPLSPYNGSHYFCCQYRQLTRSSFGNGYLKLRNVYPNSQTHSTLLEPFV